VRTVAGRGLLEKDGVSHHFSPACFKILFCVFGSKSIDGRPAIVTPFLGLMFILAMAALEIHKEPPIPLHELDCVADLHV
jgi:hypothetical protein